MFSKFDLIERKNIKIKRILNRKKKYKYKKRAKKTLNKLFFFFLILILFLIFYILFYDFYKKKSILKTYSTYPQDDLTLVSAYYKIISKAPPDKYLKWISNIVLLNKSIVFFSSKEFMPTLKEMRPKEYHYKTIFIEEEIEEFYSYKNFYKEFKESFKVDIEKNIHTIPLYLIWAEKSMFLKKVIEKNYFKSKCFYWIDAGYFRDKKNEMQKYINWPTTKKCFEDNRLFMGYVREFSDSEKEKIVNFDYNAHQRLQRNVNVCGNMFGGQVENTLKFINLYYDAIRLFIKKNIFIGKDQNIFTYVAFAHPEIINLIFFQNYQGFKTLLG